MTSGNRNDNGAVSLFLVIFSALFITTVAVSFVRIMISNQLQATTADLSQSALDSANAGVEDAKRAIVIYRNHCMNGGAGDGLSLCNSLLKALNDGKCNTIQESGILDFQEGDNEVMLKQSEGSNALNQAYTCVKVQLNTEDFVGKLPQGASHVIPLKSTAAFDTVVLEWFSQSDFQEDPSKPKSDDGIKVDLPGANSEVLPKLADWPLNRPTLMKVQLIQYGKSFMLGDFDKSPQDGQDSNNSNNSSVFLYPFGISQGADPLVSGMSVSRRVGNNLLQPAGCVKTFNSIDAEGQYACKAILKIPKPIGVTNIEDRHAYLKVTQMYNQNTSFRVTINNEEAQQSVKFSAVQPSIDSTGRANDLFRRVKSRVELDGSSVASADMAVDIAGSLCKNFSVTAEEGGANASSSGDPCKYSQVGW